MRGFKYINNLMFVLFMTSFLYAGEQNGYIFSGNIYFDYMHGISTKGPRTDGSDNGFEFRRAYFTVDKSIDDHFSVRYRMDADRKADDKLRPFMKHLYLQWKELLPSSALYIGMSGTPTWSVAEDIWGYRGLAKTVWDNFKDVTAMDNAASSAAVGLALKGGIGENISYHSMLSNGPGYGKPEDNAYKKLYTSVAAKIADFIIEGYVDHEAQNADNDNLTLKGFAGFSIDGMAFGAEYYWMNSGGAAADGSDLKMSAISVFGRYKIMENSTLVLRYDMYEPDAHTDDNETGLLIAAYDYKPGKGVSVIPNINYYINSGGAEADIIGYLTFLWAFK